MDMSHLSTKDTTSGEIVGEIDQRDLAKTIIAV